MTRPCTLTPEVEAKIQDYIDNFEEHGEIVPSFVGLCRFIKKARQTVYDWKNRSDANQALLDALEYIDQTQHVKLINGGLSSAYNPAITKLMLANHGYSDKVQQDNVSTDGSMATVDSAKYKEAQKKLEGLD